MGQEFARSALRVNTCVQLSDIWAARTRASRCGHDRCRRATTGVVVAITSMRLPTTGARAYPAIHAVATTSLL
jgi:hypothetical protein